MYSSFLRLCLPPLIFFASGNFFIVSASDGQLSDEFINSLNVLEDTCTKFYPELGNILTGEDRKGDEYFDNILQDLYKNLESDGTIIGNGGDPLRIRFNHAQKQAAQILSRMGSLLAQSNGSGFAEKWLRVFAGEMSADIMNVPLVWVGGKSGHEVDRCASTLFKPRSPIQLGLRACSEKNMSQTEIIEQLIHETSHHFGIKAEHEADEIAAFAVSAWQSGNLDVVLISAAPIEPRKHHGAVLLDHNRVMIWGGEGSSYRGPVPLKDGAIFDIKAKSWQKIAPAPFARVKPKLFNIGHNRIVVWGGQDTDTSIREEKGLLYDVDKNVWTEISPGGRNPRHIGNIIDQQAVWTGKELIIWGVEEVSPKSHQHQVTGWRWSPETGDFVKLPPVNGLDLLFGYSMVWTNKEVIILGGIHRSTPNVASKLGAAFNPTTNSWRFIAPSPIGLKNHQAVWVDDMMLVYGGTDDDVDFKSELIKFSSVRTYNPRLDEWQAHHSDLFFSRSEISISSLGGQVVFLGGKSKGQFKPGYVTPFVFETATGQITPWVSRFIPESRSGHTATATEFGLVVIGGETPNGVTGGGFILFIN